ncbi:GlsB/YeaQ/YmgE family stress response membrane protein [Acuticoccus sp. I52.16.1]|uniref:GlsB/YeaQ/YmgE family stress response membrane protein n=1 Tax=Acuticoccus sp. I52.16.1 TaxID=2928472 RepID=UPI001FD0879F|nr:GlsB/YeaQ/YmgE family stress response membrane protein [Acuticoccus sp. I52.16.1]UOM36644.1 GlsB/YeaQ/YmgE family stress response membrane protein [Acuticoccus sp. I52.16.1]
MEEFFQALGTIGLIFLVVVGVLAGFLASAVQGGRNKVRNIVVGVVGALLLPLIVAVLATGVLAAGGLVLILLVALVGAVAVLAIVRLIFR